MSKILVIGVGSAGRNTVQRMKEVGIPDANYITFGCFCQDYENGEFKQAHPNSDIPHYNLIEMNEWENISAGSPPKVHARLAEDVKEQIKEVIKYHFEKDANGLISKDTVAHEDGLYIIYCKKDKHAFKELCRYRKGERIWKYFTGEYKHTDGCAIAGPINYQYISETDEKWETGLTVPVNGDYIIAYAFQDNAETYYGCYSSCDVQYDKVNYELIYAEKGENFMDLLTCRPMPEDINWENVKLLSYYMVYDCSELTKIEDEIQELEEEINNQGLFSRIAEFFGW